MTDIEHVQTDLCRSWKEGNSVQNERTPPTDHSPGGSIDPVGRSNSSHEVMTLGTAATKCNEVDAGVGTSFNIPLKNIPPSSSSDLPSCSVSLGNEKEAHLSASTEGISQIHPRESAFTIMLGGETLEATGEKGKAEQVNHPLPSLRSSRSRPESLSKEIAVSPIQSGQLSPSNASCGPLITSVCQTTTQPTSTEPAFSPVKTTLHMDQRKQREAIPESIVQQFNEIAKMNKDSLRSKRTMRPLTSTVTQKSKIQPDGQGSLSDESRASSTKTSFRWAPRNTGERLLASGHVLQTSSVYCMSSESRKPYHARFHSDEITHVPDYSALSNRSDDSKKSANYPVTSSSSSSASASRQPSTYVRASTAERLPLVTRNSSAVLRSKSAASSLPHVRHHTTANAVAEPKTQEVTGVVCVPRSLHGTSIPSHHSGTHTESNEGSTHSLPSLNTAGDGSDALLDLANEHGILPDESDPSLTTESAPEESMVTSATGEEKPAETESSGDNSTNDIHLMLLKRKHIVKEMIQVEKEYVNSLATLVNAYMVPLRQEKILDDQQVETIFYKVSELLNFHLSFLNTLQMWEMTNTVGDKLVDMFSREAVATCYCAFVENFPNSEKILENCWNTKSSFQKFCEQKLRTLRSKLPLKALLVQPVQRIPRYELLINRLIEYTPKSYSDSALLNEAKVAIHRLAIRVNTVQADGQDESLVEGSRLLERLLTPAILSANRVYMRHDIVSLEDKKDPVCIFTFTDQIVLTVTRRRGNQAIKKPLFLRLQSPKGVDTIENIKYKIFNRLAIEAIELEPIGDTEADRLVVQYRELRDKKDLALLAEIENITSKLDYRHQELDAVVRQLYQSVQQELEDLRTARTTTSAIPRNMSVITATTKEGIERYELIFPTREKRQEWERTVTELKRQLSSVKQKPLFHGAVEISRTLSGIQLSCAAVVEGISLTRSAARDVWICAADGYTGYICLLTLHPKPMVYLNTPLAGCNSRITCICAAPGYPQPRSGRTSDAFISPTNHLRSATARTRHKGQFISKEKCKKASTKESKTVGQEALLEDETLKASEMPTTLTTVESSEVTDINSVHIDAVSSKVSTDSELPPDITNPPDVSISRTAGDSVAFVEQSEALNLPELTAAELELTIVETKNTKISGQCSPCAEDDEMKTSDPFAFKSELNTDVEDSESSDSSNSSDEEREAMEDTTSSGLTAHMESTDNNNLSSGDQNSDTDIGRSTTRYSKLLDPYKPTMWLGTEEGSLFIFYATDNIRTSRQKQRIELQSSVTSILHLDVRMFVACLSGDIYVYELNSDGLWDVDAPRLVKIQPGKDDDPVIVRRMLAVAGNIWCAARRFIYVLNSVTLSVELSFPLNGNPADPRGIQLMAYGNQTVWLATENSPRVSLYHATTGEFLIEIDLKPIVLQSLKRCDEIVMRHKEACLRITCLTVCKDLLWVGTSAGIIVTVAIPRVYIGRTQSNMEPPQLEVIKQGHIGHVRFLVSLEYSSDSENAVPFDKTTVHAIPTSDTSQLTPEQGERAQLSESKPESRSQQPTTTAPLTSNANQEAYAGQSKSAMATVDHRNSVVITETNNDKDVSETRRIMHPHNRHCLLGMKRASIKPCTVVTQMKVISGGDGYEEFAADDLMQQQQPPEQAIAAGLGDNDSINHILIWDVH